MAEKEEEEARAVLEQAARSGKIKLPTADGKLDKEAILSQARRFGLLLRLRTSTKISFALQEWRDWHLPLRQ